jgi:hypothetical protein
VKTFASRVAAALTLVFLLWGDRTGGDDAAGQRGATIVISEFMASNVAGLRDRYGERSDWIELHNAGAEARMNPIEALRHE